MQPPVFRTDLDLSPLLGTVLTAHAQDDGYWHLFVALRDAEGQSYVFTTEEQAVAARFEVFPLRFEREATQPRSWREFSRPFVVADVVPLWRSEWTEAGSVGPTLGAGANTQYAGRGPASTEAISAARVLAGALLAGATGEFLLVASSTSAPFNVEIVLPEGAVKDALHGFEPVPSNLSLQPTASGSG